MSKIEKIVNKGLCLGCGLCEAVFEKKNVEMKLDRNGFFIPVGKIYPDEKERVIHNICPGINIKNDIPLSKKESVWGHVLESYSAHSLDSRVRTKGSSGGIISEIAIYLLENNIVDSVLQVGSDAVDFKQNSLRISKNKEDVLSCAASRYAPALIFNNLLNILKNNEDKFCFIGKPCDISGLRNFLGEFPEYTQRFVYCISIVCAGIPSFAGTQDVIDSFAGVQYPIKDLTYRGNGWPGYFSFIDSNKKEYQMSYNDSWGKILGKQILFRCKICPDGIGLQADIVVGDAWETKDGYPDFTEREGQSLVLLRTKRASNLFSEMIKENRIDTQNLDLGTIRYMQPFQYSRRMYVGARILALYIIKGTCFHVHNTKIWNNLRHSSIKRSIREFLGTARRLIKSS